MKRRSKDAFKGRHFEAGLIVQAVSWYLRYPLSYRDVEDTPPHNAAAIAEAMRSPILQLCRSGRVFDIAAVAATLDMAKSLNKPALPVINAAPARRILGEPGVVSEARQALSALGATPWAGQITNRAAFPHALASGQAVHEFEPTSAAAIEMGKLWEAVRIATGDVLATKRGRK